MKNTLKTVLLLLNSLFLFAQSTTQDYTEDTGFIANPERGVFLLYKNFGTLEAPSNIPPGWFDYARGSVNGKYKITLSAPTYSLNTYRNSPLPQSVLDIIDNDFAIARQQGFKLLPHFNYVSCSKPDTNGRCFFSADDYIDASADQTVAHLNQLKPIFEKNADVLAAGIWGMYGHYGEQWGTQNSTGNREAMPNDATRKIFQGMVDATPINRMFDMRYMPAIRSLLGTDEPCPESEAFTGTTRSRVGHYNDCFLQEGSSENDPDQGPWSYTSIQGDFTPDFCVADPNCGVNPSIELVTVNLDKQHFDFITPEVDQLSQVSVDDPRVLDIYKKIGYRYILLKSTIQNTVSQGNSLSVSIDMKNDGYASIFNERKIEFILRNKNTGSKYVFDIKGDNVGNRLYFPRSHKTTTWNQQLAIDASIPVGSYEVLLNLPDPYASIHDRPEYSIHLANQNVWEESTGYNNLQKTIEIIAGNANPNPVSSDGLKLINPGFEESFFTGWADWGGNTVLDTQTKNSGNNAFQLKDKGGRGQSFTSGFKAGEKYTVSAYVVASNPNGKIYVGAACIFDGKETMYFGKAITNTGSFEQTSFSFTIPVGTKEVDIYGWSEGGDTYGVIDDFNLVKGGSAKAVEGSKSITGELNSNTLSISPNPNNGTFNVTFDTLEKGNYKLEVTNLLGQIIFEESLTNFSGSVSKQLSLSIKEKGVYVVTLTNSNNTKISKKLILN